jgi:hypothetical protein
MVWQEREVEGTIGIANVHHHLDGQIRQLAQLDPLLFKVEHPFIDKALVAFGAGYGHGDTIGNEVGRVSAANHRGNAEFARNDRGVAGSAATVRDDGCCPLHHGFPVRIRHVGDEHLAILKKAHFGSATDNAGAAGADSLTNATPAHKNLGA